MGIKATSRKIIRIEYLDSVFVFTVRHMTTAERAAIKARTAEIEAIAAATKEGNEEALKSLGKNTDLEELANSQTADMVLDVEEEVSEGVRKAASFEVGDGADLAWKELSLVQKIEQIGASGALFSHVWAKMARSLAEVRVLGK